MKKFFNEFKKFIARGNVLDLAVGVIIGGAFTAIVTALTNNILKPFINWLLYLISGSNSSLQGVYTFLVGDETDILNAIYIDWGSFISAVINFLLVAIILFIIIKAINKVSEGNKKISNDLKKGYADKETRKLMKEEKLDYKNPKEVIKFKEKLQKQLEKEQEEQKKLEEEKAKKEREENPTTEDLLKQIKEILEKK